MEVIGKLKFSKMCADTSLFSRNILEGMVWEKEKRVIGFFSKVFWNIFSFYGRKSLGSSKF